MNPELQRNFWLELTRGRVLLMVALLFLVFLAELSAATFFAGRNAEFLFYVLVVVWGARQAAQAVVGEIRDRTWDAQRLSSLTPWALTWGKLLGATSYVWLGGLICLSIQIYVALSLGLPYPWLSLFYYLSLGLMAQAVALFASLLAVRRRQSHSRLDVFLYQLAGLFAAWLVWWTWRAVSDQNGAFGNVDSISWWGQDIDGRLFHLASVVVFLLWALIGCYRLMRVELQVQNTPLVWACFVIFMAAYAAGFDVGNSLPGTADTDLAAARLLAAVAMTACLTYLAVLFEPKDRVLYRWLGKAVAERRFGDALRRVQAWIVAYAATVLLSVALLVQLGSGSELLDLPAPTTMPMALAALGFLTRDLAIFMIFAMGKGRSDYPALVAIAMLYSVVPLLLGPSFYAFFYPTLAFTSVEGPIIAWAEAIGLWFAVVTIANRGGISLHRTEPHSLGN